MSINLYLNGSEILYKEISFKREDNICESTSVLEVSLSGDFATAIDMYDVLVLYEDGIKKGTYKVVSVDKNAPGHEISVTACNSQKDLLNHFIVEQYDMKDYPLYKSKYWLELFLTEAGVSYSFTATGDGEFLPEDLLLGRTLASDEIKRLLQYSGWYMRYDENGTAIIGTLDYDAGYYSNIITDSTILQLDIKEDDSFLRNRAVVWGKQSPSNGAWVFADLKTTTPWNYDDNDYRAVVIANHYIEDPILAYSIARKALTEFTRPNIVKTVKIAGFIDTFVGDRVYIASRYYNKICTVTTLSVELSKSGWTTTLILDERCPRLIGYFNYGGYVYVGTEGNGIWRKPIKYTHVWEDFSTGLGDMSILDLHINDGTFAALTLSGGIYYRWPWDIQWNPFIPSSWISQGVFFPGASGWATTCTVDRTTSSVWGGFVLASGDDNGEYRSWVTQYTVSGLAYNVFPVEADGESEYYIVGMDHDEKNLFVTAYTYGTSTTSEVWWRARFSTVGTEFAGFGNAPSFKYTDVLSYGTKQWSFPGIMTLAPLLEDIPSIAQQDTTNTSDQPFTAYGNYIYFSTGKRWNVLTDEEVTMAGFTMEGVFMMLEAVDENKCVYVSMSNDYIYTYLLDFNELTITAKSYAFPANAQRDPYQYNGTSWYDFTSTITDLGKKYIVFATGSTVKQTFYYICFNCQEFVTASWNTYVTDYYGSYSADDKLKLRLFHGQGDDHVGFWAQNTYDISRHHYVGRIDVTSGGSIAVYNLLPADFGYYYTSLGNMNSFLSAQLGRGKINTSQEGDVRFCCATYHPSTDWVYRILKYSGGVVTFETCSYLGGDQHYGGYFYREFQGKSFHYGLIPKDYSDMAAGFEIWDIDNATWIGELDGDVWWMGWDESLGTWISYNGAVDGGTVYVGDDALIDSIGGTPYMMCNTFYYRPSTPPSRIVFVYTAHYEDIGTTSNTSTLDLLKLTDQNTFEYIDSLVYGQETVEISKSWPVFAYGGDTQWRSGGLLAYDVLQPNEDPFETPFTQVEVTPTPISWYVNDGRLADIVTLSGYDFPGEGVVMVSGYSRVALYCIRTSGVLQNSYIYLMDFNRILSSGGLLPNVYWATPWVQFSGEVNHLETTNNGDMPYIFASLNSNPVVFYQRDTYQLRDTPETFVDRTTNLPNYPITVIRTDDSI